MSTPPCDGRQCASHSAAGLRAPAQDHLAVQRAQHGVLARRQQPGGLPLWHAAAEPRARAPGGRARGRGPGGCRRRHRGQRRDEHRHRMLDVGRALAACARCAGAGQHALGAPRRMDGRRAAGRNLAALPAGRAVRARAVRCWRAACSSAAHCHFGIASCCQGNLRSTQQKRMWARERGEAADVLADHSAPPRGAGAHARQHHGRAGRQRAGRAAGAALAAGRTLRAPRAVAARSPACRRVCDGRARARAV